MAFRRKNLIIKLDYVNTSKTFSGYATEVNIVKPGPPQFPVAGVKLYGLPLADLEAFTVLAFEALEYERNTVTIYAGELEDQMTIAFKGEVKFSFGNFNSAPDPYLEIYAISGFYPSLIIGEPESIQDEAQVSELVQKWSVAAGYNFVNFGVTSSVRNCVFNGSPIDKIQSACSMVDCFPIIDDDNIILLPKDAARSGPVPKISSNTGMRGYPTFTNNGIRVTTIYRPDVIFGCLMDIESVVPKSTGQWQIVNINHTLTANMPHDAGPWETQIEGYKYDRSS